MLLMSKLFALLTGFHFTVLYAQEVTLLLMV